jgi:hypothetical protein
MFALAKQLRDEHHAPMPVLVAAGAGLEKKKKGLFGR